MFDGIIHILGLHFYHPSTWYIRVYKVVAHMSVMYLSGIHERQFNGVQRHLLHLHQCRHYWLHKLTKLIADIEHYTNWLQTLLNKLRVDTAAQTDCRHCYTSWLHALLHKLTVEITAQADCRHYCINWLLQTLLHKLQTLLHKLQILMHKWLQTRHCCAN